jgi:PTS system nitrogen regulatory IIA component
MADLTAFLSTETVLAHVTAANKKILFQQLASVASTVHGLDSKEVFDRMSEREKLGSTGFGGGVAIPHAKIEGLRQVVGMFARLVQPIDFGSVDDLPVDLVFMLLSPVGAGAEHLKALATVSRRLRDRGFTAKLRGAGSPDALLALLAASEARDAA